MLEPLGIMGDGNQKFSWSTGRDVGRIIPHVLAHPSSRNAICPVAATAYYRLQHLLSIVPVASGFPVDAFPWLVP